MAIFSKNWEACLYSDYPEYREACKSFRTFWRAARFMRKHLEKGEEFYCATIWRENTSIFYTFYWNGKRIIHWKYGKKPWVFSRRQARKLRVNKRGHVIFTPYADRAG